MGLFGLKTYNLYQISHRQSHSESLRQYYMYFGKPYVWVSKVTQKTRLILDKV